MEELDIYQIHNKVILRNLIKVCGQEEIMQKEHAHLFSIHTTFRPYG